MPSLASVLGVAFVMSCTSAVGGTSVPRMTAIELVQAFMGPPDVPVLMQDAQAHMNRRAAEGYLNGVADSTQGTLWCDKQQVKSGEINAFVVAELRKLPEDQLKVSAARLVAPILKRRFPCK